MSPVYDKILIHRKNYNFFIFFGKIYKDFFRKYLQIEKNMLRYIMTSHEWLEGGTFMIFTIENKKIRFSVDTQGAQPQSVYSKVTDTEYLWQGDKAYWGGRAYNLFPFIGRMYNNTYTYAGKEYTSRTHGLARYYNFQLESRSASKLVLLFTSNEETLKEYPFTFEYRVIFEIKDNVLTVTQTVKNTDDKTLICAFGGHPGVNIPFDGGVFEDYYVEFSERTNAQRHFFSETSPLMAGRSEAYELEDGLRLHFRHDLFDNDAVVLANTSRHLAYKSKGGKRELKVHFEDFKYIGFWHPGKTDAPFVCFEPWTAVAATEGIQDELETKADMTHVAPNKTASVSYSLEICE